MVLLDEIEKAHPDVFNILLQVLDDGRLTDSQGRTVSFKNTVLIMTSNLGSDIISGTKRSVGFGTGASVADDQDLRDRLDRRLREQLRPEFINRIDEIIVFRQLETDQLRQITEMMLEETRRRLHAQDVDHRAHHRRPSTGWRTRASSPSSAPGRCAGRSSASWTTGCPRCCSAPTWRPGSRCGSTRADGTLTFEVSSSRRRPRRE